jgi:hypothetical protein
MKVARSLVKRLCTLSRTKEIAIYVGSAVGYYAPPLHGLGTKPCG